MQTRATDWRTRACRFGMLAALLGRLLLATLSATAVGAANFSVTVTTTVDSNSGCATSGVAPCSLRDAIAFANTHTGASDLTTITVPANNSPYTLTQNSTLVVAANAMITGADANTTLIDGNNTVQVLAVSNFLRTPALTINNVTIQHGRYQGVGGGGGIYNASTLTLNDCIVSNNTSTASGGGIFNAATLTLNGSIVSNNSAISGGGVFDDGAAFTVSNSQFIANHVTGTPGTPGADGNGNGNGGVGGNGGDARGGAIAVGVYTFSVTGSSFFGNTATGGTGGSGGSGGAFFHGGNGGGSGVADGGAIAISSANAFSITGSTFSGNIATGSTGGIGGVGNVSGTGGTGGGASGGAISNGSGTLMNSTFTMNQAIGGTGCGGTGGIGGGASGGAVFNGSMLAPTNSTFTTNQAIGGTGGIGGYGGPTTGGAGGTGGSGTGGAVFDTTTGSSSIRNATIAANSASGGAGGMGGAATTPGTPGASGIGAGGGLANAGSQLLRAVNTLLSANTGGATTANCSGAITDGGHNLEYSPTTTCAFSTFVQNGTPNLDTLKDNGGPTQTMALLSGSAAKDTPDPATCAAAPVSGKDQRGVLRRSDRCSIGAFEADPPIPNAAPPSQPSGTVTGNPPSLPPARPTGTTGDGAPNPIPQPRP